MSTELGEGQHYSQSVKSELLSKAIGLSGKSIAWKNWQLVGWLTRTNGDNNKVGRALSLILNALVRQSTTKPFDIIATFVGEHIMVEVRDLGTHVPCWFYLRETPFEDLDEYLVCFPELFLKKNENGVWTLKDGPETIEALRSLMHVRCKHHYEVVRVEENDRSINVTLRDKAVITEYPKGAVCGCIPVPGKRRKKERNEPAGVNVPEVVVTSPVVGETLEQLSRVWQDPYAKSVLISSPPGSGKEVFANSIPVGNGRLVEKVFSLSMASDDQKGLERQLYGFARPDGSIQDGLIAKASGAALFLDEVHQPETQRTSAARASLLRTLEAETYSPQDSVSGREVENVLWIMATSKTLKELGEFKPVDFWTRMTHALEIPHPLNFVEDGIRQTVVADFFRTFWWDLCEKQYLIDPISDPNQLQPDLIPAYWQQRAMLAEIVDGNGKPLRDKNEAKAEVFASYFLDSLNKKPRMHPAEFSVRGIRNMVTRLFAIAWSNVAQGRPTWGKVTEFEEYVGKIFNEIRNMARIS